MEPNPVVEVASGKLRGAVERGVYAFKAIPYAAAPVGPLRFRPPAKPLAWPGVRDATEYGAVPFQHPMPGAFGELATPIQPQAHDSLLLNVWTPDPAASGMPVLVWIHGGAYFAGSGSDAMYNGAAFARDGVVCVTINYRLGAEGFLYLGDRFEGFEDSGCNGTADQIAALEWVRDNIAKFGGDCANVTIAGESAGAFSVATLMAAPSAKGLFRRAISQSGGGHNVVTTDTAGKIAAEFLRRADVRDLAALQALSGERTVEIQAAISAELMGGTVEIQAAISAELMGGPDPTVWGEVGATTMAFKPTVGAPLLPQKPIDAIAAGSARGVDLLIGWNAEEALLFVRGISEIFDEATVRATLDATTSGNGAALFELYQRNRPGAAPFVIAAAAETDRLFRIPSIRLAQAQASHAEAVYMYRFDWRSRAFDGEMGAFHLLEVPFVFDTLDADQSRGFTGEAPASLASLMHGAWVSFIRTGSPAGPGLPAWPRYEPRRRATMVIDTTCGLVEDPAADERALWADAVL